MIKECALICILHSLRILKKNKQCILVSLTGKSHETGSVRFFDLTLHEVFGATFPIAKYYAVMCMNCFLMTKESKSFNIY